MTDDEYLEGILPETDPEALWTHATRWLAAQGFDRVIHLAAGSGGQVVSRTTLGGDFEAHYRDSGFDRCDPFPAHCLSAPGSIATGADYIGDYPYLSPAEAGVIHAASEAGFRAGFSALVRRDRAGWEAWNIGSSLRRAEVEAIRHSHGTRLRLGLAALRGRLAGAAPAVILSRRERQCLDLLSQGLRTKAIAGELGLSAVTVEFHLRNARGKLGAATRDQALLLYRRAALPTGTDRSGTDRPG